MRTDDDAPTPTVADLSRRTQSTHQALRLAEMARGTALRFDALREAAVMLGDRDGAVRAAELASEARAVAGEFETWREAPPTEPVRQGLVARLTELATESYR